MAKRLPLDALRITIPGGHQLFRAVSPLSIRLKLRELEHINEMWVTDSLGNKLKVMKGETPVLYYHASTLSPSMQKLVDELMKEPE